MEVSIFFIGSICVHLPELNSKSEASVVQQGLEIATQDLEHGW